MVKRKVRYLNYVICRYCHGIISNPKRQQKCCKADKYVGEKYQGCDVKMNSRITVKQLAQMKNWYHQNKKAKELR